MEQLTDLLARAAAAGPDAADLADAFDALAPSLADPSQSARALHCAALIAGLVGRPDAALDLAARAAAAAPDDADAAAHYGGLLLERGDLAAAEAALRRALALAPLDVDARFSLALLLNASGRVDEAITALSAVLALDPDHLSALSQLAAIQTDRREPIQAAPHLLRLAQLRPRDPLAQFNLGLCLHQLGRADLSLTAYRRALALDPEFEDARVNLLSWAPTIRGPGRWSECWSGPQPTTPRRQIFVLCQPKSGSTFLTTVMERLAGVRMVQLSRGYLQNEQEFDRASLGWRADKDFICHHHTRATEPNLHMLQAFGAKVVVLARDLPDALTSMADFIAKGAVTNTFFPPEMMDWPLDRRLDAIIAKYGNWSLEFYASWTRVHRDGTLPVLPLRYEDMIADKVGTIRRVCDFYGLARTDAEIAAAVARMEGDAVRTLFNRGVAGRGREAFSDAQRAELARMAGYYPDVDFAPIGVGASL